MLLSIISEVQIFFHPLDQFEIFVLYIYWPSVGMPIGMTLITNLTIFCIIVSVVIRKGLELSSYGGKSNINTLIFKEMYILIRNVIKNNTSLKDTNTFLLCFFYFYLY